jgi:enolase-phosphatase E1
VTVLLLDIEGTVCPLAFVHEVMFPFARARLDAWVAAHPDDPDVAAVRAEGGPDVAATLHAWMDADRKHTALKAIQGRIWRDGFESGTLVAPLYPDVRPTIAAWRAAGARVAIYSSGSAEAQRLLFGHTTEGSLLPQLDAFFDTTVGAKREPGAYSAIAAALAVAPGDVCFCSDIAAEIDAAVAAGMRGVWITRGAPGGEDVLPLPG